MDNVGYGLRTNERGMGVLEGWVDGGLEEWVHGWVGGRYGV
jgi:hypothetical protein